MFASPITFHQTVTGIWQRPPSGERRNGGIGTEGKLQVANGVRTSLGLLVRIGRILPMKKHMDCQMRALNIVRARRAEVFENAPTKPPALAKQ